MSYWVGVTSRPPQKVIHVEDDAVVTAKNYPQFAYVVGPFSTEVAALKEAATHVNRDGTFTDPFTNGGAGR